MDEMHCKGCAHFCQHYVFNSRKIFRVHCGHCTLARLRTKKPDSKACEKYVQTDPDEEAFVTKEYLSKELLKYVLELELLPEIHDMGK